MSKAAALLRAFDPGVDVLSTRALAARTGIPRSTVHVLATTLAGEGLLETVPGRGWRLGPLLVGLAGQIIERTGLVAAVEGALPGLLRVAGQEVHVGQLVGGWVVYLHRAAGPIRAPMDNRVGLRAPAWRGGCGKAALSRLDPADVDERIARLCRDEGVPAPDRARLADELAAARRTGYVVSSSFQAGRTSVAAAVVDADDRPVGGLSVAGPSALFTRAVLARTADDVVTAAARARGALPVVPATAAPAPRPATVPAPRGPAERNVVVPPPR
ncbi:IclR family transcriptional regulator [Actinomycetospora cinnamomea]|uniref:IclR family transcriptional regulator n=1 Tax=Actinomycetospora cinnamomea TaxID=663609 RepID=A0A2U1FIK9_9PSEU|nr:IclR family transcriptional regulator C-terminal domain-containing protein [Actinomycetospora cinnamomea]PVZ12023.1 IclR family transcriptional regulator [Actinomycetospora cinnamomea]